MNKWDAYFLSICETVAKQSTCLSRQFGAILVRDKSIISTGYNGPARDVTHCQGPECPRHRCGYKSGQRLDLCPATHAEANCIANAARNGILTLGSTLYLNGVHPCKDCTSLLINAGVAEIVCLEGYYDTLSLIIAKDARLSVRYLVKENLCGRT